MSRKAWNILDTGICSAKENMRIDEELLEKLDSHSLPILHFYDWDRESATYGYFVSPESFLDLKEVEKKGLQLARRPTGGGIVFHIWDLAFSVLVPASHSSFSKNTLDNYAFVNQAVLAAVQEFLALPSSSLTLTLQDAKALDSSCSNFCMARPTKYDLIFQGKKIAGAAQRKTKKGFLHQGTIALKIPQEEYLRSVLLPHTKVLEAMQASTFALLQPQDDLQEGRRALRHYLQKTLTREIDYVAKK